MRRSVFVLAFGVALGGCVNTPRLDLDGVAVSQVVQRIKCEIAYAMPDLEGTYPTGQFQWMQYWTAKVDLTLETTETSAVVASNQSIDPIKNAVLPGIGSIMQNFTLGYGAGITAVAYRNDKMSFTLAMKELKDGTLARDCESARGMGLLGNLGLQEWVRSTLAPVAQEKLSIGFHQPPNSKPTPLTAFAITGPSAKQGGGVSSQLVLARKMLESPEDAATTKKIAAILDGLGKKIADAQPYYSRASAMVQEAERMALRARDAAFKATREAHDTATRPLDRLQPTYDAFDIVNESATRATILVDWVNADGFRAKKILQDDQRRLTVLRSEDKDLDVQDLDLDRERQELQQTLSGAPYRGVAGETTQGMEDDLAAILEEKDVVWVGRCLNALRKKKKQQDGVNEQADAAKKNLTDELTARRDAAVKDLINLRIGYQALLSTQNPDQQQLKDAQDKIKAKEKDIQDIGESIRKIADMKNIFDPIDTEAPAAATGSRPGDNSAKKPDAKQPVTLGDCRDEKYVSRHVTNLAKYEETIDTAIAKVGRYIGKARAKDQDQATGGGEQGQAQAARQSKQAQTKGAAQAPNSAQAQGQDQGLVADVLARAKEVGTQVSAARDAAGAAWNLLPRDPPLDSIGHAVKFTVTTSANATPSWSLVRYKGPGVTAPFANIQRTRVHTLELVLGAPAEPDGKALGDEQRRQLFNQKLDALRLFVVPIQTP